jgi:hypothetical protein
VNCLGTCGGRSGAVMSASWLGSIRLCGSRAARPSALGRRSVHRGAQITPLG